MSQMQNGKPRPEIVEGRPNTLLGVTPMSFFAARITNSEGAVRVCGIAHFGRNPETGDPHFSIINPAKFEEWFSIPSAPLNAQILEQWKRLQAPDAALPEGKVGSFDLTEAV